MLRRYAGVDGDIAHLLAQALIVHAVQVLPGQDAILLFQNPQIARDGAGREPVVAGDHHGLDAGAAATRHGLARGGTRRVDHAGHAQKGQAAFVGGAVAGGGERVGLTHGKGQHPQGVG